MSAACVHTLISLKVPDWVFQEIDKRRRGFLWAGKEKATGGQCLVAWPILRWIWLKRTDANRPWKNLSLDFGNDPEVKAMFNASIDIELGDGCLTLFWSDHWLGQNSPCLITPKLRSLVTPGVRNSRTVAAALSNKRWIQDITGTLTFQALSEYLILWQVVEAFELRVGVEDTISWKWTTDAAYSARSAYVSFFQGTIRFEGAKPIWKTWAPQKRRHHGLTGDATCRLCDQEEETADHLLCTCSFTQQVWHTLLSVLGVQNPPSPVGLSILEWWLLLRQGLSKKQKKGLDTAVMLVSWLIWKERNARIFNGTEQSSSQLIRGILEEGSNWIRAGAS
ncbi:hypothetical protein PAHAL_3G172600 [Panicum hallii]|uniref:Reverse transcriptase zinc-binding domain-containing protein n=1 Tax=Panicum hallii TaxID=206008 RepID=A0A2T8KIG7_9POAL|nr:hypothetical protein PAHAL_3G172600 [Panicum hallii]